MIKLLLKNWQIIGVIFVWFAFSSPYFIQNLVPYPAKFQNSFFSPWSDYEEYAVPVKNPAVSDVVTQIYPWKYFTIEEIKNGRIPWWNPFSFSGNPHIANAQTAVFSPFNLLFFILPFIDAWSLMILLQALIAGLFTALFLSSLKISKEGIFLGSITFMFCGFIVVWLPWGTMSMSIAFLPLALYAIEKSFNRKGLYILLLPLALSFSVFSGHIQTSAYLFIYVLGYIIYKFLITKNTRHTLKLLIFFLIGLAISLVQILPTLELYTRSLRSEFFSNQGAIPFPHLITSIAPDFYGNPVTRNDWVGNYAEWASYIGVIPLIFAVIAVIYYRKSKITLFFIITGICALIMATDTPLQSLLTRLQLPIISTSIPSRIIVLFSFSVAVLAGFGLDALRSHLLKRQTKKIIYIYLFFTISILSIWVILFAGIFPSAYKSIAVKNFMLPTLITAFSLIALIIAVKIKSTKLRDIVILILILIALFDSYRFAHKWTTFDPKELLFPNLPVIAAMRESIGYGRVFGKFGAYIDTYYRLPSIEGYDPLYSKRYGEFLGSAKTGKYTPAVKSLAVLEKRAKYADRVLDILGVTVIFHVIGDTNKEWAYPVWEEKYFSKYSIIYEDDKFQLYKNKSAFPFAKIFYNYEVIKNDKAILSRFYSDDFDYQNKIILEEEPVLSKSASGSKPISAHIAHRDPDKIIIVVNSPDDGLLFIAENFYPNWQASVNGVSAKILRANYTFKAVVIPSGRSEVKLLYKPSLFY